MVPSRLVPAFTRGAVLLAALSAAPLPAAAPLRLDAQAPARGTARVGPNAAAATIAPRAEGSVRFAVIGDTGGRERPQDFVKKFELPYKPLHDLKIPFYASLGNHDDPNQRFYEPFNMKGQRYYTFEKGGVRFFALDSNYMDQAQQDWLRKELST